VGAEVGKEMVLKESIGDVVVLDETGQLVGNANATGDLWTYSTSSLYFRCRNLEDKAHYNQRTCDLDLAR